MIDIVLKLLKYLIISVLGIGLLGYLYLYVRHLGEDYHDGEVTDHFDGVRFRNLGGIQLKRSGDFWRWKFTRNPGKWPEWVENEGVAKLDHELRATEVALTFVNQATFLIQTPKLNILTDPVFSERMSPVSFAGPKRVRAPGICIDQLPKIDIVLISHNHYDHMDIKSLRALEKKFQPLFITGLGNKKFLEKRGLERVKEFDWWERSYEDDFIKIDYIPAQHFSARGLFDRNRTLWGGFMINMGGEKVYFAGDTGYGEFFKEIKERYGAPKISLFPIGAYEPRWFMKAVHVNPEEAVLAHIDLGSKQTIGMHFETFQAADEPFNQPLIDLEKAKKQYLIEDSRFITYKFGETRKINLAEL